MKKKLLKLVYFMSLLLVILIALSVVSCKKVRNHLDDEPKNANCPDAKTIIADWPKTSQEVAMTIIEKYGQPSGRTFDMLVWNHSAPWKKTIVFRDTVPHNFPTPHADLLQQFIDYKVPVEKFDDMAEYDGSVILERTKGEMSARCDKEGANFLAINLANDVATGAKTVHQARNYYTQAIKTFVTTGEMDPYMQGFVFELPKGGTKDPDVKTF